MEVSELRLAEKEKALAQLLANRPVATPYQLACYYHHVPVHFYFETESLLKELKGFLPASWLRSEKIKNALEVYWLNPRSYFESDSWQEDVNSDCRIRQTEKAEVAIQRDFVGLRDRSGFAALIANQKIDDGFFNALRWLLPREMVSANSLLLHSSCVVGRNGKAYFFLGPSGAGKTTVTQMSQSRIILGDDMNVLSLNAGRLTAEAGAVGQRFSSPEMFSKQFPVGGFFWLKQSQRNYLHEKPVSSGALKLLSSCANLFWADSEERLSHLVLPKVAEALKLQPMYELEFNLDGGFWKYVDESQ